MKKIVKIIAPLVVAGLVAGGIIMGMNTNEEAPKIEQSAVTFDGEAVMSGEIIEVEETKPAETNDVVSVAPAIDTKAVEEEPLSLLDYAKTQLDLSSPQLEACFNMIVEEYPERFNGSEAHRNVRALKGYANVCSSGIKDKGVGNIYTWDRLYKGAYFDSDIANANA